jgi:hypothetical protein
VGVVIHRLATHQDLDAMRDLDVRGGTGVPLIRMVKAL